MLDTYSQHQRESLTKLRPDWRPYFEVCPYKDSQDSYLLVTIPSSGNSEVNLFLYTADEEITVSFGVWEWHYPNAFEPDSEGLTSAITEVDRIQKDEHLIASYWRNEKWVGSRIVSPGEALNATDFAEEATVVKVLSWSGRLNREVAL